MKFYTFAQMMIALLFLTAAGCSKHKNKDEVPEAVIVQFDNDHKDADKVYWEPAEKGFQATFKDGGIEKVAFYSKEAKPLRVEYVVEQEEVPTVVITKLGKKYPKASFETISYVEVPGRKPFYMVKAKDPKAVFSVEISPKGIVLRRRVLENLVIVGNLPQGGAQQLQSWSLQT